MDAAGLRKFYFEELKWCGCGDPEGALVFMGKVLGLIKTRSVENTVYDLPYDLTKWAMLKELTEDGLGVEISVQLALSYIYMLNAVGLTEHGGSVTGGWLTDKGLEVLAAILEFPGWLEEDEEPE